MIKIDTIDANLENCHLKEFILTEVLLYQIEKKFPDQSIEAANYLLYETIKDVFDGLEETEEIYYLKRKQHQYKSSFKWKKLLEAYMKEAEKVRLFKINGHDLVKVKSEIIIEKRYKNYKIKLKEENGKLNKEKKYCEDGNFKYLIKKRYTFSKYEQELNEIHSGSIPSKLIDINKVMLPRYKEKKSLYLDEDFDWKPLFKKLGWKNRNPIHLIKGKTDKKEKLVYENITHIVGGLGSGKSNYKKAETVRLCRKFGAKVGIIETNVNDVLAIAKELRKTGLEVAVILGKGNLKKHRDAYIRGMIRENEDITKLMEEENQILSALSGSCEIAALAKHYDIDTKQYPCEKLMQGRENQKMLCPLHNQCGFWNEARKLMDADVWIGTPYSLVYSRIPKFFDSYNRTYYEAVHDLLDLVFMDECDEIQQIFDSIFIPSEKIFSENDYIISKLENLANILTKRVMDIKETRYHTFINNLSQFKGAVDKTRLFLAKHRRIESFVSRRPISPNYLMMNLIHSIEKEKNEEHEFRNLIGSYYESSTKRNSTEFQKHDLFQRYNKIRDYGSQENPLDLSKKAAEELMEKYSITLKKKVDRKLFIQKIQLYIYLVQVDYYFNHLVRDYPFINEKLGNQYEIVSILSSLHKSILSFVTEPMLERYVGYKFHKDKRNDFIAIELVAYVGMGRSLMYKLPHLKKEINKQGPAVIMLSGTSIAPASGHYDMYVKPQWLLKSDKKEGEIYQEFFPVFDETSHGEMIKVSGISDREEREKNLARMVVSLENKLNAELKEWKNNKQHRKILMIVNSYLDCEVVGEALKSTSFKNSYYILNDHQDVPRVYEKEMLESFAKTEGDILVAPMTIIERGYNILDREKSYFGSIFFLIRPYSIPGDFYSTLSIIHSTYNKELDNMRSKGLEGGMKNLQKHAYEKLNDILNKIAVFDKLNDEEKIILAWYTMVSVKQSIGRLQRGGTDCRVFYVDGSFGEKEANMLTLWCDVLVNHMDNIYVKELYNNFYEGLRLCVENMEALNIIEEDEADE
ncbi:MAG: hypothetical protein N4A64_08475 [Marinisporobacter sp.]|jgi:hypothetical protein|nr:hypothetical protein [Marinisporobacter sp.]